jgi:hypothetical protein
MILKFPARAARRIAARRPRRSKNGTPEERAAKAGQRASTPATVIEFPRRAVLAEIAVSPALAVSTLTLAAAIAHKLIEAVLAAGGAS